MRGSNRKAGVETGPIRRESMAHSGIRKTSRIVIEIGQTAAVHIMIMGEQALCQTGGNRRRPQKRKSGKRLGPGARTRCKSLRSDGPTD